MPDKHPCLATIRSLLTLIEVDHGFRSVGDRKEKKKKKHAVVCIYRFIYSVGGNN